MDLGEFSATWLKFVSSRGCSQHLEMQSPQPKVSREDMVGKRGLFIYLFICLFRAASVACGGSQARGQIRAVAISLHHSHSNTGSLTHWTGSGIEPMSSWMLVRFGNRWAMTDTPFFFVVFLFVCLFLKTSSLFTQWNAKWQILHDQKANYCSHFPAYFW